MAISSCPIISLSSQACTANSGDLSIFLLSHLIYSSVGLNEFSSA